MDNETIKTIAEHFPELAPFLACVVAFFWLIKNLQEIISKRYVSKLNKEVLSITLSSVKSKELIENLQNLQDIVSEIESASNTISDRIFFTELKSLHDSLGELVKTLPDDWEFRSELTVQHDWLANFIDLNNATTETIEGVVGKNEKEFYFATDQLSKKSSTVFYSIDELINIIARYKEKADSTIDWVATAKGAGSLCLLLVFSYGLVSTVNLQEEFNMLSTQSESFRQEISSLKNERDAAVSSYALSERKVERLTQELAAKTQTKKDENEEEKPNKSDKEFMIKINWNEPSDLDLMLKLPNGEAISYRRTMNVEYEGTLQRDIQTGPGGETIILQRPQPGLYEIIVSNYSQNGEVDFEIQRISNGSIIWKDENKVNEKPKIYQFSIN